MDKRVMIVKILLVAVYLISECECERLSLDEVMCPDSGKAVVRAAVANLLTYDANGNLVYRMDLEEIYKEGRNALKVSNDLDMTMRFPTKEMSCGFTFPNGDFNDEYIIAGDVDSDGILSSDMCQYVRLAEDVSHEPDIHDLLTGRRKPSCVN